MSSSDAETTRPHGVDWGRVADGVFLAGLGVFFLLATLRGLPDGYWVEAISLWPVLLVSAGIRIVFERTPLAFGVLLGPAVVLGTLCWLAWGQPPEPRPPGDWQALAAEGPEGVDRARLVAELFGARLDVAARSLSPGRLAEGRAASRAGGTSLHVHEDDGQATLRLRGRHHGLFVVGMRKEIWDVGVTDALPLSVDLSGALLSADLDLRRAQTSYAEVSGAFNAVTLRLPPPTETAKIRFEGAFSLFDVIVPEGTPVRYRGPSFPVNFGSKGLARDSLPEGVPGYDVSVDGAFTVLNIDEGPPPEKGWPQHASPTHSPTPEAEETLPPAEAGPAPPAEADPVPAPEQPDPTGSSARH